MASLSGKVVEYYTGRGVAGALVSLGGVSVYTDANGDFTVQVAPGRWTLQVVHRSFQPYASAITLSQNMAYNLQAPIRVMSVVRAL